MLEMNTAETFSASPTPSQGFFPQQPTRTQQCPPFALLLPSTCTTRNSIKGMKLSLYEYENGESAV